MSAIGVSANRLEILQIANAVAHEKAIDKDIVIEAMEEAIQKAARSRYGQDHDIRAHIDRTTGEQKLWRCQTVVEAVEDPITELSLEDAQRIAPDSEMGSVLKEALPPFDFGRVAAQTAKQVIIQKVRDAERDRHYQEYKDRVGEVLNGIVKRVEYGHVIVGLDNAEGIIRRGDGIPRENFQAGDRIRAYLYKVVREQKGPQIFLSRAHPELMVQLFTQEVPEIYENIIRICSCARDPGSRAKIGVISNDASIDPVGACVGMRGARVQAVVSELAGEKVDIIPWSEDPAAFIVNALQPAEISKVVLDEDEERVEVVVADSQFPLAIGRRGQNVRLASQLTGWQIDLTTETQDSERYQREFQERTDLFMKVLDADETLSQLLASEGFESVEEIAYVARDDLMGIEGFNEEIAEELQTRATEFLERQAAEHDARRIALGVEDAVMEMEGITPAFAVKFGENDVRTLEDFAGLVADDVLGWREPGADGKMQFQSGILDKNDMLHEEVEVLIMRARVQIGWAKIEDLAVLEAKLLAVEEEEGEYMDEAEAMFETLTNNAQTPIDMLGADNEDITPQSGIDNNADTDDARS